MTLTSIPFLMDATTADAQLVRGALSSLMSNAGGVVSWGDFYVNQQGTPNMSVSVSGGRAWIPGTSLAAVTPGSLQPFRPQGQYYVESDAAVTLPIGASNPSNPRVDTICIQIEDKTYAGANTDAIFTVVPGTPTAGVTSVPQSAAAALADGAGTPPASSLVIAYVLVPAGASSIVTADIAYVTPIASSAWGLQTVYTTINMNAQPGQLIEVNTPANLITLIPRPAANATIAVYNNNPAGAIVQAAAGLFFGRGLSGASVVGLVAAGDWAIFQGDGSNWLVMGGVVPTPWTPLVLPAGVSGSIAGSYVASARLQGDIVTLKGALKNNTGGAIAPTGSGFWATLPTGMWPIEDIFPVLLSPATSTGVAGKIAAANGQISLGVSGPNAGILPLDGYTFSVS